MTEDTIDQELQGGWGDPIEYTEMPEFRVADMVHVFDMGYGDEVFAGLVAVAIERDVEDILSEPISVYVGKEDPEADSIGWKTSPCGKMLVEARSQLLQGGEVARDNFTGLISLELAKPLPGKDKIRFRSAPSVKATLSVDKPLQMDEHPLSVSVRLLSQCTGETVSTIEQLFIGDYKKLQEEYDRLTPSLSSI